METRSNAFFKKATNKLEIAKAELLKPAEDLVSFSICKNAQFAVENYLKGYLIKNNVTIDVSETISTLYNKCIAIDENFKEIDLSAIGCREQTIDSRYCTEINSVSACFDAADSIDTFLRKRKLI